MAVNRQDNLICTGDIFNYITDQSGILCRLGIAHGVGNIDYIGALGYYAGKHGEQEFAVAAGGILTGEFHKGAQSACTAHGFDCGMKHLIAGHAKLVLHVYVRGGDKGVQRGAGGVLKSHGALLDIGNYRAAKADGLGVLKLGGYGAYGFKIAGEAAAKPASIASMPSSSKAAAIRSLS